MTAIFSFESNSLHPCCADLTAERCVVLCCAIHTGNRTCGWLRRTGRAPTITNCRTYVFGNRKVSRRSPPWESNVLYYNHVQVLHRRVDFYIRIKNRLCLVLLCLLCLFGHGQQYSTVHGCVELVPAKNVKKMRW